MPRPSGLQNLKRAVMEHGGSDECLVKPGQSDPDKYATISINYKTIRAHQASAMEYLPGYAPGLVVHHTCSNKACFNPKHLQLVTQRENLAEMHERNYYIRKIAELEARVAELESKVR